MPGWAFSGSGFEIWAKYPTALSTTSDYMNGLKSNCKYMFQKRKKNLKAQGVQCPLHTRGSLSGLVNYHLLGLMIIFLPDGFCQFGVGVSWQILLMVPLHPCVLQRCDLLGGGHDLHAQVQLLCKLPFINHSSHVFTRSPHLAILAWFRAPEAIL